VCFPSGIQRLCRELPYALEDAENGLTPIARELLARRFIDLLAVREEVKRTSQRIVATAEKLEAWPNLMELPGFGVLVSSSYLASIGNGRQFQRGRQVSAWLGLVPRQHGTGGKVRLYGMTKSGDRYLRTMMLHGARAAIRWSRGKDTPLGRWINPLIERRGFNKAVVALANKNARIAWHIVARGAHYDPGKAFGSA
jgi:transposase